MRLSYGDPLLAAVRYTWSISDTTLIRIVAVATALVLLGGPAVVGQPLQAPGVIVALLYSLALLPLGAWIYLTLPERITRTFEGLKPHMGKPLEGTRPTYDDLLADLHKWLASPLWIAIALVLVVIYWIQRPIFLVPADVLGQVPPDAKPWLRVPLIAVFSPILYGGVLSAVRLTIAMVFTVKALRSLEVSLTPFAADRASGLGSLGDLLGFTLLLATSLGVIAVAMGALLLAVHLDPLNYPETRLLVIGELVLLPTALILLGWLPHQAMTAARARMLRPIADQLQETILRMQLTPDSLKTDNDLVVELKRRYELLEQATPTWPLRLPAVRGLSLGALISLVPAVLTFAQHALQTSQTSQPG
jgi:hypothetical protein